MTKYFIVTLVKSIVVQNCNIMFDTIVFHRFRLKVLGHLDTTWAKSVDLSRYVKKYHRTPYQITGVKDIWRFKADVFGPLKFRLNLIIYAPDVRKL